MGEESRRGKKKKEQKNRSGLECKRAGEGENE